MAPIEWPKSHIVIHDGHLPLQHHVKAFLNCRHHRIRGFFMVLIDIGVSGRNGETVDIPQNTYDAVRRPS